MKQEKILISVVGPTGIGKTKLAIELAQYFETEIISCDARQFFKEIPIGTAMPDAKELSTVKHHFIANLSINDNYSIGKYEKDALDIIEHLFQNHNIVILVGGSGMYEKAVIEGLDNLPEANDQNIEKLTSLLEKEGIEAVQKLLKESDPVYYKTADINNPRRLFRALDIFWQTRIPYSKHLNKNNNQRNFKTIRIGIDADRELLYDRINQRVDIMMEKGLLKEASLVYDKKHLTSLQTVGYKELFKYFDGDWDLEFAISEIKKNSRRYAKRQLTWYRKSDDIYYLKFGFSNSDVVSLLNKLKIAKS